MSGPSGTNHSHQLLETLTKSGAINHEALGKVIAETMPTVLNPGTLASDDYIAKGYSSVVQVWKVGAQAIVSPGVV